MQRLQPPLPPQAQQGSRQEGTARLHWLLNVFLKAQMANMLLTLTTQRRSHQDNWLAVVLSDCLWQILDYVVLAGTARSTCCAAWHGSLARLWLLTSQPTGCGGWVMCCAWVGNATQIRFPFSYA
jgi:hypothetical protein